MCLRIGLRHLSRMMNLNERQNLLEAIQVSFSDLSCGEGPSSLSPSYFLQRESERWGLIDVTGYI